MPGLTASNMKTKSQILEFEKRWALLAGIMAMGGVALVAVSYIYAGTQIPSGDGLASYLTKAESHRDTVIIANILQAIGLSMLAGPLVYMFLACVNRSERVKTGLLGVMIVAPIFLGAASITNAFSTLNAATAFKNEGVERTATCVADKNAEAKTADSDSTQSAEDIQKDCADQAAEDVRNDNNGGGLTVGLGLAGAIGFAIGVVYVSLWSMRLGLLTRFWGSLGMALGAVSFLFLQFTLLWFIFVGLLIVGWIPKGRPPAWEAGEAMPWLLPGEQLDDDDDVIDGTGEPVGDDLSPEEAGPEAEPLGERIKRKKRRQPPE